MIIATQREFPHIELRSQLNSRVRPVTTNDATERSQTPHHAGRVAARVHPGGRVVVHSVAMGNALSIRPGMRTSAVVLERYHHLALLRLRAGRLGDPSVVAGRGRTVIFFYLLQLTAKGRVIAAGRYRLFDWNLTLVDTVGRRSEEWRAVIADREYRIMRDVGDPDGWSGDLGYRRLSSSVSSRDGDRRAPAP